ncbi:FUSC family protein [Ancylobacter sp. IITR112]|uniref:FUSC family protein n=1 Tax=Ancylobacter sp. IITR112 TaxID=3138073 RepID=UPI00352B2DEF
MPRDNRHGFLLNPNWRTLLFSSRLAGAAIVALALAYWLELQEPQWAILTVYLLTQSSTGAALAKGAFRFLGTILAALYGLAAVKLFSQDPLLLVGSAMVWIFLCYYGAAQASNFTAYGFMLAGFTGLLVTFQGAAAPAAAWLVAVDRVSEISIGIACATLAGALVLPDHAGTQLRGLLAKTLRGLCAHAALTLRAATRGDQVIDDRRSLLPQIVKFDALRSYTRFEAPEMRADRDRMDEVARRFLGVLAQARALHLRLAADGAGTQAAPEALRAALERMVALLERGAADPALLQRPERHCADLSTLRLDLAALARRLSAPGDATPLAARAEAVLICRQAGAMLRELALLCLAERAVFEPPAAGTARHRERRAAAHGSALLQGGRAALGLMIFCAIWYATQWDQGIAGITGLALMNYQCVNTDDPQKLGWPYLRAVVAACFAAYATMVFIYPWLEGFEALALFLLAVLVPAGLLIATPRYARTAGTFTIFYVAAAATGNVFTPDPLDFANFCFGLAFGMFVCLMVVRLVPATARASRRRAVDRALGVLLPEVARGQRAPRAAAREILGSLGALLAQLTPARPAHDRLLRGLLACAASAGELGRLREAADSPALPPPLRAAIAEGLERFAGALAPGGRGDGTAAAPPTAPAESFAPLRAALAQTEARPGAAPASLLAEVAASLCFLEDRTLRDQAFRALCEARA